MSLLVFY